MSSLRFLSIREPEAEAGDFRKEKVPFLRRPEDNNRDHRDACGDMESGMYPCCPLQGLPNRHLVKKKVRTRERETLSIPVRFTSRTGADQFSEGSDANLGKGGPQTQCFIHENNGTPPSRRQQSLR